MPLNKQEQKLIDQVLRNAPITNRARDVLRKLYLIAESDVYTASLTKVNISLPTTTAGVVTYTSSGTTISVFRGDTQLTGITSGTPTTGQFKVTVTDDEITAGAQSVTDTHNITLANSSAISDVAGVTGTINLSINVENVTTLLRAFTLVKSPQGATGATGAVAKTVSLSAGAQIISYNAAGDNGSGTITLTATSQNFTNAFFRFVGGGSAFTNETSYADGDGANLGTATFTIPSDYSANAYTFTVSVKEGASGAEVASDTVTIGSIQPGADAHPNDILELIFEPASHYTVNTAQSDWFKNSSGDANYTSTFYSKTEFDGRCFCSFVWDGSPAARMRVGISSSVAAGNPGGSSLIEIVNASGWKGRTVQTGASPNAAFGAVSAGDRFSLRYDGTNTTFYHNGAEVDAGKGQFIHSDGGTDPVNIGGWMITGSIFTANAGAAQITDVIFLP